MRDPERIGRIMQLLEVLWWEFPDQRLGQILENYVFGHHDYETLCIFHQEDDVTEIRLEEFLKNYGKFKESMRKGGLK